MSETPAPYRLITIDLERPAPGPLPEARALVTGALRILERIESGRYPADRVDSVTWRLADALQVLGEFAAHTWPGSPTPGITTPTGRGAKLEPTPSTPRPATETPA